MNTFTVYEIAFLISSTILSIGIVVLLFCKWISSILTKRQLAWDEEDFQEELKKVLVSFDYNEIVTFVNVHADKLRRKYHEAFVTLSNREANLLQAKYREVSHRLTEMLREQADHKRLWD